MKAGSRICVSHQTNNHLDFPSLFYDDNCVYHYRNEDFLDSPDGSVNPFAFFFKKQKIAADSRTGILLYGMFVLLKQLTPN